VHAKFNFQARPSYPGAKLLTIDHGNDKIECRSIFKKILHVPLASALSRRTKLDESFGTSIGASNAYINKK